MRRLRWAICAGKRLLRPAKWTGERDATKYGAHCAQNHVFDDMVFQDGVDSEDCLFLNVYAPADCHRQEQAAGDVLDPRRRILGRRQLRAAAQR